MAKIDMATSFILQPRLQYVWTPGELIAAANFRSVKLYSLISTPGCGYKDVTVFRSYMFFALQCDNRGVLQSSQAML